LPLLRCFALEDFPLESFFLIRCHTPLFALFQGLLSSKLFRFQRGHPLSLSLPLLLSGGYSGEEKDSSPVFFFASCSHPFCSPPEFRAFHCDLRKDLFCLPQSSDGSGKESRSLVRFWGFDSFLPPRGVNVWLPAFERWHFNFYPEMIPPPPVLGPLLSVFLDTNLHSFAVVGSCIFLLYSLKAEPSVLLVVTSSQMSLKSPNFPAPLLPSPCSYFFIFSLLFRSTL